LRRRLLLQMQQCVKDAAVFAAIHAGQRLVSGRNKGYL